MHRCPPAGPFGAQWPHGEASAEAPVAVGSGSLPRLCELELNSLWAPWPSSKIHSAGRLRQGHLAVSSGSAPPSHLPDPPLPLQPQLVTNTHTHTHTHTHTDWRCRSAPGSALGASEVWVLYLRTPRAQRPQMAFAARPSPKPSASRSSIGCTRQRKLQLEPSGACVTADQAQPGKRCHGNHPLN